LVARENLDRERREGTRQRLGQRRRNHSAAVTGFIAVFMMLNESLPLCGGDVARLPI
jgi:hypothetical protein